MAMASTVDKELMFTQLLVARFLIGEWRTFSCSRSLSRLTKRFLNCRYLHRPIEFAIIGIFGRNCASIVTW